MADAVSQDEVDIADEVEALLVTTETNWAEELGKLASRPERQRRRSELMTEQEQELRRQLGSLPVELERLEALGSWTIRGKKAVLAHLRDKSGPLARTEFQIVPDDEFRTT